MLSFERVTGMSELLPRPRLVLRIGVTGHRDIRNEAVPEAVRQMLEQIKTLTKEILSDNQSLFDSRQDAPVLRLISSLAEGADRLVAHEAHRKGYKLHAILPFPREVYAQDPDIGSVDDLRELLERRVDCIVELDNTDLSDKCLRERSYEAAGRLVLRQSDILLAVWDGKPEQGVGGTGQIVREALDAEIPTLWIDSRSARAATTLLVSKKDLYAQSRDERDMPALLRERLRQILLPYSGPSGKYASAEAEASDFFDKPPSRRWQEASELPPGLHHNGDDVLRAAFERADNYANRYARIYRRSYLLIFSLGALAVLFAYLGSIAEQFSFLTSHYVFLILELIVLVTIIVLAFLGQRHRWHERWLDYRYLAEGLRMMRLLALVGRVGSYLKVPAHVGKGDPGKSWCQFYLRALVRQTGLVAVPKDDSYREGVRKHLYMEVVNQERYHRKKSSRSRITHNLWHELAKYLFIAALVACGLHFIFHDSRSTPRLVLALNLMVIVLPAVGGAIGAILNHGESERVARRSQALGERLKELKAELLAQRGQAPTVQELGRLAEDFSSVCLAELMDWRFLFLDRPLGLPA